MRDTTKEIVLAGAKRIVLYGAAVLVLAAVGWSQPPTGASTADPQPTSTTSALVER